MCLLFQCSKGRCRYPPPPFLPMWSTSGKRSCHGEQASESNHPLPFLPNSLQSPGWHSVPNTKAGEARALHPYGHPTVPKKHQITHLPLKKHVHAHTCANAHTRVHCMQRKPRSARTTLFLIFSRSGADIPTASCATKGVPHTLTLARAQGHLGLWDLKALLLQPPGLPSPRQDGPSLAIPAKWPLRGPPPPR